MPYTLEQWRDELACEKRSFESWQERARKIIKRYRDERSGRGAASKYNVLWSNVQTLKPAVYTRPPKPEVSRRYDDQDPVGRAAAMILERCISYEVEHYPDYTSMLGNALLDRLLGGRGIGWIRYEPVMEQSSQVTEDVGETLKYEFSPCDYVAWQDFRHQPAKTWEEVEWVARDVYMDRDALHARFEEAIGADEVDRIPLEVAPPGLERKRGQIEEAKHMKKARITEIWHKPERRVYWVAEGYGEILDEKEDPLELDCFFPCARPLYATLTTDCLIPVPDYAQYQDQADEIDQITARITSLTKALRVAGVRDASAKGLERLLSEHTENTLVPVENWAMFADKGIAGAMSLLPIETIAAVLTGLYAAREQVKQTIYEITGLSDIIRGASKATETATAQQIKSQYASLRIQELQNDMARFATDYLRMKAQLICKYQPQTIIMMSGAEYSVEAKTNPQILMQALELLRNDDIRAFRVEVNADSMIQLDEKEEKESRIEFLTATGAFLEKAVAAAQAMPDLAPVLGEMMRFGIRGFRAGREVESAFDKLMASGAKPQDPNAPQQAAEAQKAMQAQQQQLQQAGEQLQREKEGIDKAKMQLMERGQKVAVDELAVKNEKELIRIREEHKRAVESLQGQYQGQFDTLQQRMGAEKDQGLAQVIEQLGQQLQMIAAWMQKATEVQTAGVGQMTERMDAIGKAVTAKRVLRRDKAGRAVSSEIEMP